MAKVLIIEDDDQVRSVYTYALSRSGFEVTQAGDANTGLQLLQQDPPAVLVLDMLMPGMSGLDLLRQINVKTRFPGTKVIAFSNIETPRVITQARALGADEYMLKVNVTPHQMVDAIKKLAGVAG